MYSKLLILWWKLVRNEMKNKGDEGGLLDRIARMKIHKLNKKI